MDKMKKIFGVFVLLFVFNFIGCAQENPAHRMTAVELIEQMKTDSTLIILDVRTPPELTGPLGSIEGVINIPIQELDERMDELENYKSNNIAVICRSGNRSRVGTGMLQEAGYNAKNVVGGMIEYNKAKSAQ